MCNPQFRWALRTHLGWLLFDLIPEELQEKPLLLPPHPMNRTVPLGGTVTFQCRVKSEVEPHIKVSASARIILTCLQLFHTCALYSSLSVCCKWPVVLDVSLGLLFYVQSTLASMELACFGLVFAIPSAAKWFALPPICHLGFWESWLCRCVLWRNNLHVYSTCFSTLSASWVILGNWRFFVQCTSLTQHIKSRCNSCSNDLWPFGLELDSIELKSVLLRCFCCWVFYFFVSLLAQFSQACGDFTFNIIMTSAISFPIFLIHLLSYHLHYAIPLIVIGL